MKITHLNHSAVLLESQRVQVFIDCYFSINHLVDQNKKVYVLASHGHLDHWSPGLLTTKHPDLMFLLSDDIVLPGLKNHLPLSVNETYQLEDFRLQTFGSTDLGISVLLEIEDKRIFHSGDLNWWHWKNSSREEQIAEKETFLHIIEGLPKLTYDAFFIPVDPNLEEFYSLAAIHVHRQLDIKLLCPIHFDQQARICKELDELEEMKDQKIARFDEQVSYQI